jgi:hypothetical protein
MGGLGWALSWLIVLAVGLAPILLYWTGGIIRGSLRRKRQSRARRAGEGSQSRTKASERK